MAAGRPVVSTSVGEIHGLIADADGLVRPGDSDALARALVRYLEDGDLATEVGMQGRVRLARDFSSARIAEQYEEMYQVALGDRGRAVT